MTNRYTHEEDFFLVQYGPALGFNFVARHDLGRPKGSGMRRAKVLIETGAALAYCQAQVAMCRYHNAIGDRLCITDNEDYWGGLCDLYREAMTGAPISQPVRVAV